MICNLLALFLASVAPTEIKQEGIASYYGYEHAGRKTANGEIFNPNRMTAAHKTLPFGTIVEVECLDSNKKTTVRINDRGPYIKGRIIDLSRAAAKEIGILKKGITPCKIRIINN